MSRENSTRPPCSAQKAATCKVELQSPRVWEGVAEKLSTSRGHFQASDTSPTPLSRVWKWHPALPDPPPCILPDEQQTLRGTALEEWEFSKSRLNGAHMAPGPWHLLFLGRLELSCGLQLIWWSVSHLSATLTECLLSAEHSCTDGLRVLTLKHTVGNGSLSQGLLTEGLWTPWISIAPSVKWE